MSVEIARPPLAGRSGAIPRRHSIRTSRDLARICHPMARRRAAVLLVVEAVVTGSEQGVEIHLPAIVIGTCLVHAADQEKVGVRKNGTVIDLVRKKVTGVIDMTEETWIEAGSATLEAANTTVGHASGPLGGQTLAISGLLPLRRHPRATRLAM